MSKNIFLNKENKLRDILWVPIFFGILFLLLFPLILASQKYSFEVSIPIQAFILLLVTLICQSFRKSSFFEVIGIFNFNWLKQFLIGLGIGSLLMILPAMILFIFGFINFSINNISLVDLLNSVLLFLSVAIAEELLFRGFIFQRLTPSIGQWPTQLVIAILFLLTHQGTLNAAGESKILGSLNIFIASLMFGIAFIRTKSLALPIGIHFMANFMQGTILGFGVSGGSHQSILKVQYSKGSEWIHGGSFGLEASIFGLVSIVLLTMVLYYWKRPNTNFK